MTDAGTGYEGEQGQPGMMSGEQQDFMEEPALRFVAPLVEGRPPSARGGHTSALVNDDTIVLFGGTYFEGDGVFAYLNDVWCLDLGAMTWYQPKVAKGAVPEGRYGHTATLVGKEWFIFGGRGAKGRHLKDMWRLDMSQGTVSFFFGFSLSFPTFTNSLSLVGSFVGTVSAALRLHRTHAWATQTSLSAIRLLYLAGTMRNNHTMTYGYSTRWR